MLSMYEARWHTLIHPIFAHQKNPIEHPCIPHGHTLYQCVTIAGTIVWSQ